MIKIFVVDDSAVVRGAITSLVEKESDIELLGTAQDPIFAMNKFKKLGWPDVIILDIEMPRMDGLSFLKQIMAIKPTPVIICSSIAQKGSRAAIDAFSLGAVEVLGKPEFEVKNFFEEIHDRFLSSIRAAARSKLKNLNNIHKPPLKVEKKEEADIILPKIDRKINLSLGKKIVAIGSSTGGVQTIEYIIKSLPNRTPPIIITQHMPQGFTKSFAERLNHISEIRVKEAVKGEKLEKNCAYISPGDLHMMVKKFGNDFIIDTKDGPRVSRHKPSVDVLFRSCANEIGSSCAAFILTGMGDDGAKGLKEIKDRGGKTFAQDEKSCVVYGMPKEAVNLGAVDRSVTPHEIVLIIKAMG